MLLVVVHDNHFPCVRIRRKFSIVPILFHILHTVHSHNILIFNLSNPKIDGSHLKDCQCSDSYSKI